MAMLLGDPRQVGPTQPARPPPVPGQPSDRLWRGVQAGRRVEVDADDLVRPAQRAVRRSRRDVHPLAGTGLAQLPFDDEAPPPGKNEGQLILAMEMHRQGHVEPAYRPQLDDAASVGAPIVPNLRRTFHDGDSPHHTVFGLRFSHGADLDSIAPHILWHKSPRHAMGTTPQERSRT
nr:hypothetical protein [Azospirillum brasilense]